MMLELNKIYQGDWIELAKQLDDESIDMIMTSPPYWGLRDYGTATWIESNDLGCDHIDKSVIGGQGESSKKQHTNQGTQLRQYKDLCKKCGARRIDLQLGLEPHPQEYINKLVEGFGILKSKLKKTGSVYLNLGDTYYGSGSGTQYEPDLSKSKEVYVLPYQSKKSQQRNLKEKWLQPKQLMLMPSRVAIAMQEDGWILRNDIIWHKPNPMPSSVKDRLNTTYEHVFHFVKSRKYFYDLDAIREAHQEVSFQRESYGFNKGTKSDQSSMAGLSIYQKPLHPSGKNPGDVIEADDFWEITTHSFPEAHFATYPEKLCEKPIKSSCPEMGVILDPFAGSGTTCLVARKLSRQFIGFELNQKYIEIANNRLKPYMEQKKLSEVLTFHNMT